jgi:hypothetical protein
MSTNMTFNLLFLFVLSAFTSQNVCSQSISKHFIFFSEERAAIHDSTFYSNPGVVGAQITYPWKELEPQKDSYDFSKIEEDLNFLTKHGKRLFIQLQDVTFDSTLFVTPQYILTDTIYHGGADSQYETSIANNKFVKAGWVTRRWDPAVAERFHKLLKNLGERFDGKIEGINLPETAVDFPRYQGYLPKGFTDSIYLEAIKRNMLVLRNAFRKSVPLLYANFMPGDSKQALDEIYSYAKKISLGVGGPDIKVYRKAQMENSYLLIQSVAGIIPTGVAVQNGNYEVINPKTGKQVTLIEILDFAQNFLRLDYVFWCTQEPFYTKQVLPLLKSLKQ